MSMTDTHTHTDLQLHIFSGPKNEQKSIAYVFPHLFVFIYFIYFLPVFQMFSLFPLRIYLLVGDVPSRHEMSSRWRGSFHDRLRGADSSL